jgi:aminoglycoside 2''-phosphotransferase
MPTSTEELVARARAILPELEINHVERNNDGAINDILIVNRAWAFRFTKALEDNHLLAAEQRVLEVVRPHLSVAVPQVIAQGKDYWVYPLLAGEPLSRVWLVAQSPDVQQRFADRIAAFLYELHSIDLAGLGLPPTRAPVTRERWLDLREQVRAKIYPLLQAYQIEWADALLNGALDDPTFFEYTPALIHGDLASYHLLRHPTEPTLTGALDFGMAGVGDPASDFGNLISIYGETFVRRMRGIYPALETLLPRARFYAQALEFEWTLRGLEDGELFWFTAHLGNARDVGT